MGELEEKIKKELQKSGFPLEIFCQRCLLEKNWDILESSEYYVLENDTRKQVDVVGYFTESLRRKTPITYECHIECKKSADNPWVFFEDVRPTAGVKIHVDYESIEAARWSTSIVHAKKDLHFNNVAKSSIYTMAFKKGTNQIYEAISSILSYYEFRSDFLKKHREQRQLEGERQNLIIVSFLTILFDGKLYLANIEKGDNINLTETNNIILCQAETKFPRTRSYTIDIVTRDYFLDYLDLLNRDRELISNFYKREMSRRRG